MGFHPNYQLFRNEGPDKWKVKMGNVEDESQPLIKLGLGIGGSTLCCNTISNRSTSSDDIYWLKDKKFDRSVKVEADDYHDSDQVLEKLGCNKSSVVRFTEEQLVELERQLIIFKYMVWGLPVPQHLIVSLWKSLSPSCAQASSNLFVGIRSKTDYHRYWMDPEPGRCRRTDGKKWRCYQSVVPNQKYCEKHMHRGRKRSRKLVEDTPAEAPNMIGNLNVLRSNSGSEVLGIRNSSSRAVNNAAGLPNIVEKTSEKVEPNNEEKHIRVMKERIGAINQASGFDFSPKSVLQDGQRCLKLESHERPSKLARQRCSWADGKSWQCFHDTLPVQKYCADHIQRGTKKPSDATDSEQAKVSLNAKFCGQEIAKTGLRLDTDLKISLPMRLADPRHGIRAQEATSSSSSEATLSDQSADLLD